MTTLDDSISYCTRNVETALPFRLRSVAGRYLLIPTENTGTPSYFFLNRTAAGIFSMMNIGADLGMIQIAFKNIYNNIPAHQIANDVLLAYNKLRTIIDQPHADESYEHAAESDFRAAATSMNIPIEGTIEITFKCNLQCMHCYCVNCTWEKQEATTEQWFSYIDDMANNGCIWLLITGGEPLIRKDFSEIFLYAKTKGMILTVFTNALLINESHCKLFKAHPPHLLEITVYGLSNDTYRRVTGKNDGFTKLIAALDLLDKNNIEYSLKTTVVTDNADELEQLQKFAFERSSFFRHDATIIQKLDGTDVPDGIALNPTNVVDTEFINDVDKTIMAWKSKKNERIIYFGEKLFFCNAGKIMFNIDPFGEMSVCGRIRTPSVPISENGFETAWNHINTFSQQPTPGDFKCKSCNNIEYCKPCPVTSFLTEKQIETQFCQFTRRRAEIIRSNGIIN